MIKKLQCKILGHKIKESKCPVTHAVLKVCERCSPPQHSSKMSFR